MNRLLIATLTLILAACTSAGGSSPGPTTASPTEGLAPTATPAPPTGESVVLMTHDSFAISDEVIESFESATGLTVELLPGGDAGTVVNQAILTREAPLADVLFGVDNTFLSRALQEDIFESYRPTDAELLTADLVLDPDFRVTPIDYGDVCLNTDREVFPGDAGAPHDIGAMADPQYAGQLVVENPATSSPGLSFMLATIVRFGESGDYTWLDYWRDLVANDVLVVSGWEEAYYNRFSGGAGQGDRPIVVSYATSPAAEVAFADPPPTDAPTGVVTDGCFRQVEFAGVLRGANNPEGARLLIDFMLSAEFQQDIPLNMFVFPARPDVELPQVFVDYAADVEAPLTMDPEQIAANRERWLQEWTDVVR